MSALLACIQYGIKCKSEKCMRRIPNFCVKLNKILMHKFYSYIAKLLLYFFVHSVAGNFDKCNEVKIYRNYGEFYLKCVCL